MAMHICWLINRLIIRSLFDLTLKMYPFTYGAFNGLSSCIHLNLSSDYHQHELAMEPVKRNPVQKINVNEMEIFYISNYLFIRLFPALALQFQQ